MRTKDPTSLNKDLKDPRSTRRDPTTANEDPKGAREGPEKDPAIVSPTLVNPNCFDDLTK